MNLRSLFFFFVLVLSTFSHAFCEGIAQIRPTAGNTAVLQIWDNGAADRNSYTYVAPAEKRLYFNVSNLNEIVYFGVSGFFAGTNNIGTNPYNDMHFRIRRPDGSNFPLFNNVLAPAVGATTTTGHIDSYDEAVAGPAQLVGATGYDAYTLIPDQTGDWWIEFNRGSDPAVQQHTKTLIELLDITVATGRGPFDTGATPATYNTSTYDPPGTATATTGAAIPGRVFCQAWDVNMRGGTNPFNAQLFVYTPDSVVLGVQFNGIQPFGFVVSCNGTGTGNIGNVVQDRRSVVGNTTRPEYKIFLNNPDINVYPSGTLPTLSAPNVNVTLCTNYEITFNVSQAGTVEILLDLDNAPNTCVSPTASYNSNGLFDQNSKDVALAFSATTAGTYTVSWSGNNGCGTPVPTGTTIPLRATLQRGLTHLPLFDVEFHNNGYTINLIRPAGDAPRLYWDDSQVGGTTELNGATSPAHTWGFAIGNNNTINTWFFIQESPSATTNFTADASTFDLTASPIGNVCDPSSPATITFEVVYSEVKFLGVSPTYALSQAVTNTDYTISPSPTNLVDAGTFTDANGIIKRRVFVTYEVSPIGDPETVDVQLIFQASAQPAGCPAPITQTQFNACPNPLPVSLVQFSLQSDEERRVLLRWTTASERNNEGFYIEKSHNGIDFREIGFVRGIGDSDQLNRYVFLDEEQKAGRWYYRLRQIDYDGTTTYSNVLTADLGQARALSSEQFAVYPNPARDVLHVEGLHSLLEMPQMRLINATGAIVWQSSTQSLSKNYRMDIDISHLARGFYILQLYNAYGSVQHKVVVE
ncbi:MAG: T9SS type A sorting domain-containing protein [Bernardetiaceae bacterium]